MSTDPSLIRILAVDDHPMLREGIAALLASQSDMKLVGEASNGREALEQFRKQRPDLTLMDLQMPDLDGIEAMVAICSEFPEARIIVLTTYKGDIQVLRALKAGARAYLLKGLLRKELLETIRAVHAGQKRMDTARRESIAPKHAHDVFAPQEAVDLVSDHVGIAILTQPMARGIHTDGVVVKPLSDTSLCFKTCVILRADNTSRLVEE
jgi:DNA-binding NarL/FixJ family response regulator